jgi:hypothetical protein
VTAAAARLAAVLLLLAAGPACGRRSPAAATVNGERILASAVDRDLADIAQNEPYLEARSREGLPFRGTRQGTFDAFVVAELLNRKVTALLVRQELERRKLSTRPGDLDVARETLRRQVVDPATGRSLLDGFPDRYTAEQMRIQAESDLLQAAEGGVSLDDDALRAAYEGATERYRVWCVRWIVYPLEADAPTRAAAARAAVTAGQDFAELATRESTDVDTASRGGALGCQTREGLARLGTAFRDAAVALGPGQVSGPTTGDLGTFLVQVTDVKVRPFEEVRASVRAGVLEPAEERYEQLLRRLRGEAEVTVSERFGTWDRSNPEAIAIVPIGGRPTTTVGATTTLVGP